MSSTTFNQLGFKQINNGLVMATMGRTRGLILRTLILQFEFYAVQEL